MLKAICLLGFVLTFVVGQLAAEPIKVHPDNPHYYLFNGKPTILITSAEHYGAVVNKDFDYVTYFDALKSYGLDYTRIYPGALFEPMGKFVRGNTLGPKPASLIVPWARSNVPGWLLCGNKFDLDKWDPEYFKRLKVSLPGPGSGHRGRDLFLQLTIFRHLAHLSLLREQCARRGKWDYWMHKP
jgi:hypothetical protein